MYHVVEDEREALLLIVSPGLPTQDMEYLINVLKWRGMRRSYSVIDLLEVLEYEVEDWYYINEDVLKSLRRQNGEEGLHVWSLIRRVVS